MNKETRIQMDIFWSPPGEMSPNGCWNCWLTIDGITYMYSGNSPEDILEQLKTGIYKSKYEDAGLVG